MIHEPNQPDNPVDIDLARALAALRAAAPPAGMEDRILQRLDARLAEPQPRSVLHSAWLRGALTGALTATAACAALFFALRVHPTTMLTVATAEHSPTATSVSLHAGDQCLGAPSIRDGNGANGWDEKSSAMAPHASRSISRAEWEDKISPHSPRLIPASFAPSHPAPPAPLTAQERALVELARNATPAELASLRPKQKSDAERQAAFDSFFAPSPEVQAIDDAQNKALGITNDESAAPNSSKEDQP